MNPKPVCEKCPLHRTCKTVKIPGRGSRHPEVVFVGQAPGEKEDLQGECFIGPAGQVLINAIESHDLTPAYLTNVARCWPPDDRVPRKDEIEACSPYLFEELKKLKPKLIVALGNVPLKVLTGKDKISVYSGTIAGKWGENKIPVFALFHPAFVLRNPKAKSIFEAHVQALDNYMHKNKVAGIKQTEDIKVGLLTPTEAIKLLKRETKLITFDFETTGEYKQYGGRIRCVGFHLRSLGMTFVVDLERWASHARLLLYELCRSHVAKCIFNSTFELRWLFDEYGFELQGRIIDPYLLHYLIDENSPHGLENLAGNYLKVSRWDIEPELELKGLTYESIPMEKLYPYCGKDCYYTDKLAERFSNELEKQENGLLKHYDKVLLPVAKLCAKFESRGMVIDPNWANKVLVEYTEEQEKLKTEIDNLSEVEDFLKNERLDSFKLTSPVQIRRFLGSYVRINTGKRTPGGAMSVGRALLEPFREQSKFVDLYLAWKSKEVVINNYLSKFPTYISSSTGKVHAHYNPAFQVTGRISVTDPPGDTIPRDNKVRGMIVSRFPGGLILSNDYKALEMRLLASESGEPRLIKLLRDGGDPHDYTASLVFGDKFTKEQRAIAKNINFGLAYGITPASLAKKFRLSLGEAWDIFDEYEKIYPQLMTWMEEIKDKAGMQGYIESRTGRIRRLPELNDPTIKKSYKEHLLRQAGNFPIQETGATITHVATILLDKELTEQKLNSILFHQIHDSALVDVLPAERVLTTELCKVVMCRETAKLFPWLKVPLAIDQVIGDRWESEEELEETDNG